MSEKEASIREVYGSVIKELMEMMREGPIGSPCWRVADELMGHLQTRMEKELVKVAKKGG